MRIRGATKRVEQQKKSVNQSDAKRKRAGGRGAVAVWQARPGSGLDGGSACMAIGKIDDEVFHQGRHMSGMGESEKRRAVVCDVTFR